MVQGSDVGTAHKNVYITLIHLREKKALQLTVHALSSPPPWVFVTIQDTL